MVNRELRNRVWADVTGLLLPMLALAAYVLGWSPLLYYVLTTLCVAGVFSTRWMR